MLPVKNKQTNKYRPFLCLNTGLSENIYLFTLLWDDQRFCGISTPLKQRYLRYFNQKSLKTSCWPCCCCLSYCVHDPPLSPPTPWHPPHHHHHHHPTRWISDLWLVETGWLCRHSPSAHSSVDLGVVLRISFAAGPISPFTNSARGKKKIERIRVSSASLPHFASSHTSICGHFWSRACSSASVGEGGAGAWLEFSGGSLRSLFNQLIGWVPLLHQKKAWEHKSPRPLEKRKPR